MEVSGHGFVSACNAPTQRILESGSQKAIKGPKLHILARRQIWQLAENVSVLLFESGDTPALRVKMTRRAGVVSPSKSDS